MSLIPNDSFTLLKIQKKGFLKMCLVIIVLYHFIKISTNNKFLKNIIFFISYINKQTEIYNIEKLLMFYKSDKTTKLKKYKKYNVPKISIISPVYNSEKYLLKFLRSVQNQNFIKIELILVDDCSIDKSVNIIENYQLQDERIILLKNKSNKGTFVSRNTGILFSKGKYIILPDPDDCISKNILKSCYKIAEHYNYDMIRFYIYLPYTKHLHFYKYLKYFENREVFQPELTTYIFYGFNELFETDRCVINKFFRKEVLIKSLNLLINIYLKIYNVFSEDSLINYITYRTAKSFFFFNKIGYYYFIYHVIN